MVRGRAPWKGSEDVGYAALDRVEWFNDRGPYESIGDIPPKGFEELYYERQGARACVTWDSRNGFPANPGRFSLSSLLTGTGSCFHLIFRLHKKP